MTLRTTAAAVLAVATAAAALVAAPAPAVASQFECLADTAGLTAHASTDGGRAVILVHGWTGSPSMWTAEIDHGINDLVRPVGRSMADQVQRLDDVDAWLLDYEATSGRWVTDPDSGGDRLTQAVRCLSDAYGQPVGVVAHSMGGLAARVAAAAHPDDIAAVVTLGTPHTGSDVAQAMAAALGIGAGVGIASGNVPSVALTVFVHSCGRRTSINIDGCAKPLRLAAAFDSDAGRALRSGSAQLDALPPFPDGVAVDAIAGDVTFVDNTRGLFGRERRSRVGSVGDWIVTTGSAQAQATETRTFTCEHNTSFDPTDDILALADLTYIPPTERNALASIVSPCQHTKLATVVEITNEALGFLDEQLAGATLVACPADAVAAWDRRRPDDNFPGETYDTDPICSSDGWWVAGAAFGNSPVLIAGSADGSLPGVALVDVDLTDPTPLLVAAGMPDGSAAVLVDARYPNVRGTSPPPSDLDLFTATVSAAFRAGDYGQYLTAEADSGLEGARASLPGGFELSSIGCSADGRCTIFWDPTDGDGFAFFTSATVERRDGQLSIVDVTPSAESAG